MASRSARRPVRTRAGVVAPLMVAVAALVVTTAGPAAAHNEISAEPAQAGAANAVLTFDAEAESATAGIASLQVLLPTGIAPTDITYLAGPAAWNLAPTADGYTVSGPPLPIGENAQYRVRVAELPDASSLVFKTLQTYSDGRVDRWIDVTEPGGAEPEHPAPVLSLAPAAAAAPGGPTGSPSVAATSPAAAPTSSAPAPPSASAQAQADDDSGVPAFVWVVLAVGVLAAVGGGLLAVVRSRRDQA